MKTVSIEKVNAAIDEMIYIRTLWFNEAVKSDDMQSAVLNLTSILDFITLWHSITGENYDELIIKYYDPVKTKYENKFLKRGE
nr:MAG TPA: hypothetical protein [Caudoviricetes sp.]